MYDEYSKILRDFICYNQRAFITFDFATSKKHQEFRILFEKNKEILMKNNNLPKEEDKILREKYDELSCESFQVILNIFNQNATFIEKLYSLDGITPRITIKTIDGDCVVDIYRNNKMEANYRATPYSENTVFDDLINESREEMLLENIPELLKKGEYKNPRLKQDKIDDFKNNKIAWEDLWEPLQGSSDIQDYKSTMVIPLSIKKDYEGIGNQEYENIFYKHFFNEGEGKYIFGFLCLDSSLPNYFSKLQEKFNVINTGFIIADILSLYLLGYFNYVTASKSVTEYLKLIEGMEELY